MRGIKDQNNSKYGDFLRSEGLWAVTLRIHSEYKKIHTEQQKQIILRIFSHHLSIDDVQH